MRDVTIALFAVLMWVSASGQETGKDSGNAPGKAEIDFKAEFRPGDTETKSVTFSANGNAKVASASFNFNDNFNLSSGYACEEKIIDVVNGKPSIVERKYQSANGAFAGLENRKFLFVKLFYPDKDKKEKKDVFREYPGTILLIEDPQSTLTVARGASPAEIVLSWDEKGKPKSASFKTTKQAPLAKGKGGLPPKLTVGIALIQDVNVLPLAGNVTLPPNSVAGLAGDFNALLPDKTLKKGEQWQADGATFASLCRLIIGSGPNPAWNNAPNAIVSFSGTLGCVFKEATNVGGVECALIELNANINGTQKETSDHSVTRSFSGAIKGKMLFALEAKRVIGFELEHGSFPYSVSGEGSAQGAVALTMKMSSSVTPGAGVPVPAKEPDDDLETGKKK